MLLITLAHIIQGSGVDTDFYQCCTGLFKTKAAHFVGLVVEFVCQERNLYHLFRQVSHSFNVTLQTFGAVRANKLAPAAQYKGLS